MLENVRLRAEAFDYLKLPFAVHEGVVGRLRIKVRCAKGCGIWRCATPLTSTLPLPALPASLHGMSVTIPACVPLAVCALPRLMQPAQHAYLYISQPAPLCDGAHGTASGLPLQISPLMQLPPHLSPLGQIPWGNWLTGSLVVELSDVLLCTTEREDSEVRVPGCLGRRGLGVALRGKGLSCWLAIRAPRY